MTIPRTMEFEVGFPGDAGFLGRECNGPDCGRYFKVSVESIREEMYCPYCGVRFSNEDLWTQDQIDYAEEVALHRAMPLLEKAVDDIFRRALTGKRGWTVKHGVPTRTPPEPPPPKEQSVDSELTCPGCQARFQVDGVFGYCPGCRSENLLLYDANLAIIRQEIQTAENPTRALRHAYNDLVSTFEGFARREAERHGIQSGRYQNLDNTRRAFRTKLRVDVFQGLSQDEIRALKRVFEKRHVHEHNRGVVNERYVREIPEDAQLLGHQAPLALKELEAGASLLRRVLEVLVSQR